MSVRSPAELAPLLARIAPYARESFEHAAELAARIHAEEISPEHWLVALLADEGCAATRAVLHAFADPETLGVEVLALCAGIMVVGSERTLPFSVLGVEVVRAARTSAAHEGATHVVPFHLFRAALARLPEGLRARLEELTGTTLEVSLPPAPLAAPGEAVTDTGPLFRRFSSAALRSLGAGCRAAASLGRVAIAPTHILQGALESDEALRGGTGLTPGRLRMASGGLDEDLTPLPDRHLGVEERLRRLLTDLPGGAETLDVMAHLVATGSEELTSLLRRQKVTEASIERCRGIYHDPAGGE